MTENERNELKAKKAAEKQRKKEERERAKIEARRRRDAKRSRSFTEKLARASARYVAMMATTRLVGGGMAGYLASMAAARGADRIVDSYFSGKTEVPGAGKPHEPEPDQPPERTESAPPTGIDAAAQALADLEAKARQVDDWRRNLQTPAAPASNDMRANPALDEFFGVKPAATPPASSAGEATAGRFAQTAGNVAAEAAVARGGAAGAAAASGGTAAAGATAAGAGGGGGGGAVAGGTAAAGAGGGAAGAAAAAGPIGMAAVAAAGLALVFYKLMEAGKNLAYEQEKHSRRLAEVNPYIAAQQGELDMNRVLRDMESGDRLAGSNQELLSAIDRYEKTMRPFEDIGNMLKNFLATEALNTISDVLGQMKTGVDAIYETAAAVARKIDKDTPATFDEWLTKRGQGDGSTTTFGAFAQQVYNEENESRRRREAAATATRNIDQEFRRR